MLKRRFDFYLGIISYPQILLGILLAIFPVYGLKFIMEFPAEPGIATVFFARMYFVSFVMMGIMILSIRSFPDRNRNLIFWISLYFIYTAVQFFIGMYLKQLIYLSVLPALFFLVSGLFLMAYASRNLLIRE